MALSAISRFVRTHYEVHQWKHACAILRTDFPAEWDDMMEVLGDFRLRKRDIVEPGGRLSSISQRFNNQFRRRGWEEKSFATQIVVDKRAMDTPTHKVDCVKNRIALEVEWSNKDPFFDRDLNNFRLLFDLRAISVGIIVTKSDELSTLIKGFGKKVWDKFGTSTTWMGKLLPRIEGSGGGGCPLIVFGITKKLYVDE